MILGSPTPKPCSLYTTPQPRANPLNIHFLVSLESPRIPIPYSTIPTVLNHSTGPPRINEHVRKLVPIPQGPLSAHPLVPAEGLS
jgi:hypothetical protein